MAQKLSCFAWVNNSIAFSKIKILCKKQPRNYNVDKWNFLIEINFWYSCTSL